MVSVDDACVRTTAGVYVKVRNAQSCDVAGPTDAALFIDAACSRKIADFPSRLGSSCAALKVHSLRTQCHGLPAAPHNTGRRLSATLEQQRAAMNSLYDSCPNAATVLSNWDTSASTVHAYCGWAYVSCDASNNVMCVAACGCAWLQPRAHPEHSRSLPRRPASPPAPVVALVFLNFPLLWCPRSGFTPWYSGLQGTLPSNIGNLQYLE